MKRIIKKNKEKMILSTTPTLEGKPIREYTALAEMSERAERMGANAVVGIDLDYETLGSAGGMLMVTVSGTAVVV